MQSEIRLVKISELEFYICVQSNLFGRSTDCIKTWHKNDLVVFIVENYIAGVGVINGKSFRSTMPLWVKEYPFRIPINFSHIYAKEERPSFEKHKQELLSTYGKTWGHVFVLRQPLPETIKQSISKTIEDSNSDPGKVLDNIKFDIKNLFEEEQNRSLDRLKLIEEKISGEEKTYDQKFECLILRMIEFIRNDPDRFETLLNKNAFEVFLNEEEKHYLCEIGYAEIKNEVKEILEKQGLYRSVFKNYNDGTYLIFGDSHGYHTNPSMFKFLNQFIDYIKPDKCFHIGHLVDDNGLINKNIENIKNLVLVTRIEEAYKIEEEFGSSNSIEIVRDGVFLGNVKVANQDLSNDYMTSRPSSASIKKKPYMNICILNHHIHEMDLVRSEDDIRVVTGFPGCLCEKHVESSNKQINYEDGIIDKIQKKSPWMNRMQRRKYAIKEYWEQGLFVVHIQNGNHTIVPCRIKKVNIKGKKEFTTSYFDKIISESTVLNPDKKTFINADVHTPLHDIDILDIQDQIVKDYVPDVFVNLGDLRNTEALNHHKIDRKEVITDKLIDEAFAVNFLLKKMSFWAKQKYILFGNHERFALDFISRFPQFKDFVDFEFVSNYEDYGYTLISHQGRLDLGDVVYVHGDLMKGVSSCPVEKLSEAFLGAHVVCGHHHYTSIRRGCYSIGYAGLRDQKYNEKTVTRWSHGFGLCNEINGVSFITSLIIENKNIILNNKEYQSINGKDWIVPQYKAKIVFDY